jgi:amino acid adenylation domain-containing protein
MRKFSGNLSPERRKLLALRRQQKGINIPETQAILPRKTGDPCPLSFAQQRLWFLDQLEPSSTAYLIPQAFSFQGELHIEALERSLEELVRRHEILRTTFAVRTGLGADPQPVQVVHPASDGVLPVIDLRGLRETQRSELAQWLANTQHQHPMSLTQGPLLRMYLLRLGIQEHIVLLTMHHIITDTWSDEIAVRELTMLYQAHVSGQPAPVGQAHRLQPLPIQYADYALWQRVWLQGEVLETQLAYWRKQLSGLSPLVLPTDHPRPPIQTHRGLTQSLQLSPALSEELMRLCQKFDVTLFMLLLSVFQILLMRYTGQTDISVGTPIANRGRAELKGVIGFFLNTLVIRVDLGGDPTFQQMLQRVRHICLEAYAHQDIPFEKVVEELEPERDLSRSPLFQVMFVLQNAPAEEVQPCPNGRDGQAQTGVFRCKTGVVGEETPVPTRNLPLRGGGASAQALSGIHVSPLAVENPTSKFDLTLSLLETRQGLHCVLRYNTDLFEADTITRLLGNFQTLLEGIVQNPQAHVSDLPLLTAREREQILAQGTGPTEWNTTKTGGAVGTVPCACPPPQDRCVHQFFEEQVQRTPDALALIFEDETLTYNELNRQANQLAHFLQKEGIGPDGLVGIYMQRSPDVVIAILGVLKAGGAYIPLDPSYPTERLNWMLQEAQPLVVLTQAHLISTLSLAHTCFICLDTHWQCLSNEESLNPISQASAESLAYLIYTSGSTGKPKGVMNTHGGLSNRLCWMQYTYQLTSLDRVLQKTPLSFDVSVWEFVWPWLAGACLIVAAPGGHQDPSYLKALMIEQQVTTLHFVPSMLWAFLQEPEVSVCGSLRQVFCSGEVLSPELQTRFFATLPDRVQLHNLYGPTEVAIDVTSWQCQRRVADGPHSPRLGHSVPIGRPIANTQIYILDKHMQLLPGGVPGELCIGGKGVARGYWSRPDLTAEKFLPDPFVGTGLAPVRAGALIYRTGDVARYQADGTIEYLGRLDEQVKLRGYRIELAEIESVLRQHPAVSQCAVIMQETSPENKQLVAYVVIAAQAQPFSVQEGHRYLEAFLPPFMIPTRFVFLERLPLTPAGKVNRRALLTLGVPQLQQTETDQESFTLLEKQLACMWEETLHVQRIGRNDSFFALGGHSITAAIFMNKLQALLGVILHVVTLFDSPTVSGLADYLVKHHLDAVERVFGVGAHLCLETDERSKLPLTATHVAQLRELIPPLSPLRSERRRPVKNPPVVLILSPPRSGSTLLRVMLAGHPQLFAPPELELLSFNTLRERAVTYQGRNSFWLEGTVRALMDIHGWDVQAAKAFMTDCEQQDLTTQDFYALMQQQLGERLLVDKTPPYALDRAILERVEATFEQARYISLLRHPYGMIRSFEEASLDQVFFRYPHTFATRELAELVWLISHQNIQAFLQTIPADRQHQVRFEDLVQKPVEAMEQLAAFLAIPFHPNLLEPYSGHRMTDGIVAASKMLGDVKFHQHKMIDVAVAERWKSAYAQDFLGEMTWQMAQRLGYQRERTVRGREAEEASTLSSRGELPQIPRLPRDGQQAFPLSFAQQRLWFLDQLQPGSTAYLMPHAHHIRGPLRTRALEKSLSDMIHRHESLRTTFTAHAGQPMQIIHPAGHYCLPLVDLHKLEPEKKKREVRQLVRQEAQRPCDLEKGPLLRVYLLRLDHSDEHVLLLTLHHIITDGWSNEILMRELVAQYQVHSSGRASPLAPLPLQYVDYAIFQREWLQGEVLEAKLDYWTRRLGGVPPIELPADYPRPSVASSRGAIHRFVLSEDLLEALHVLSQQVGMTLFMTLLAAFQVLLYRSTGQSDIVVGTDSANRNRVETEGIIGFFINLLALRTDLSGKPTFREVLLRVREGVLGAYTHQDIPFELLVEKLAPDRHLDRTPLVQVLFVLVNRPDEPGRGGDTIPYGGLEVVDQSSFLSDREKETLVKFDLALFMEEQAGKLSGALKYRLDLFNASTIATMAARFATLLQSCVKEPDLPIDLLSLASDAERAQREPERVESTQGLLLPDDGWFDLS